MPARSLQTLLSFAAATPIVLAAVACNDDSGPQGGAGGAGGEVACDTPRRDEDDVPTPPIYTPRWAYRPWISKDISTTDDTRAFVDGFAERDIPVGVVVLDSPWETSYNTFVPSPDRYPGFADLIADLRAQDVRVVLWTTQMINISSYDLEPTGDLYFGPSPDHEPAAACGYFINDAAIFGWWKGQGSAIDFFHEGARAFWHRLQDPLLDMGVAGFKLDFGESYIDVDPLQTAEGEKTLQEYSEAYYEDFYRYGSARVGGDEFVTMVRPYDESYQFEGRFFARPEHAPVAWVGDNRRDYVGMQDALDHVMRSALAGYVVIGSDIGGYLDRDDKDLTVTIPLDPEVFMRWTALGAMMPFMQLHGRANLDPWSFPERADDVTATYRFWATLHEQMVPFFDSVARSAYAGGDVAMIAPVEEQADWPDDYRYWLGGALLIVPVVDGSGVRDIAIPDDASYFDLFDETATEFAPGTIIADVDVADPTRIPVFAREGAIIPMEVSNDVTPFGNDASADALTILVFPSQQGSMFEVAAADGTTEVAVDAIADGAGASIELTEHPRTIVLRVLADVSPTAVSLGDEALPEHASRSAFDAADDGWWSDGRFVWVKVTASAAGTVRID